MPIEQPTKFELALMKAAKALGIVTPPLRYWSAVVGDRPIVRTTACGPAIA